MLQGSQASALGGRGVQPCPCARASSRRQLRLACRAQHGSGAASAVTEKLGSLFSKAAGKKAGEEEDRCAPRGERRSHCKPCMPQATRRLTGPCCRAGSNTTLRTHGGCA